MNDLNRALGDIDSIRRQVARSTEFRGYGPATLAATGGIAIVAAVAQAICLPIPANRIPVYLAIWISTAILSATLIAIQTVTRSQRLHSGLADEMIRMAVEQFLPAAGAGVLLTIVLVIYVPSVRWMLPGLWQITFSLGVFSSCRFLPPPHDRSRGLVSADRIDLHRACRQQGPFALDHGYFLWTWTIARCRHPVFQRTGGQR